MNQAASRQPLGRYRHSRGHNTCPSIAMDLLGMHKVLVLRIQAMHHAFAKRTFPSLGTHRHGDQRCRSVAQQDPDQAEPYPSP